MGTGPDLSLKHRGSQAAALSCHSMPAEVSGATSRHCAPMNSTALIVLLSRVFVKNGVDGRHLSLQPI
jgi:hypothetical protein